MDLSLAARLVLGVGTAAGLAYVATPVAIAAARRYAFYDRPAGYKGHGTPTPYLGGAAVLIGFAAALLVAAGSADRTLPMLGAAAVLAIVGTIDDLRTVSPVLRVAIEFALGAVLASFDLGWHLGVGDLLNMGVTGIWVVAVVNSVNLFDNMDGAASMMALAVCAGACALAVVTGAGWVAAGSAAMCGACLGFLPHNLSRPAKIFLGDGGSMPIGLVVAMLTSGAAQSAEPGLLGLLVGFLLLGIPALDTALVIVSRLRRGVSVLTGGRDHLTHRSRRRLKTPRRVALVLGGAQAALSALVILASRAGAPVLVYIVLAFAVLAITAIVALEDVIVAGGTQAAPALRSGPAHGVPAGFGRLSIVGLGVLGLGAGLSPLFQAYYDPAAWLLIGLGLVAIAAIVTVARPPAPSLPMAGILIGLSGLGLVSLLSTAWAAAVEPAILGANLWLSYTALFLLLIALVASPRAAVVALGAVALGIAITAITVLVHLLGSDPAGLFILGRLNSPLGYINGEGCVFAMGAWLALALAERRQPLMAGAGLAATVVMAGLAVLTQSRGAAIATAVMIVVALAVIPGFRRRVFALALVVAALAAASGSLLRVYTGGAGGVSTTAAHHAVVAIILAAVVAGLAWGVLVAAARRLTGSRPTSQQAMGWLATAGAIVLVVLPLAVAGARFSSLEHRVSTQWHEFVSLSTSLSGSAAQAGNQTRLLSGAGNRYDYWRVAWDLFSAHPIVGAGAGNYPAAYYLHRRTQEAIQNPHSLELQTLSELGIVGGLVLAVFVVGLGLAVARSRKFAKDSNDARTAMVAATGVAGVWLVCTSGDWMHLLPGVTAIALIAIAVLCRPDALERQHANRVAVARRLPALLAGAAAVLVLAVGGASLLRSALVQRNLDNARAALRSDPSAAMSDADQVLKLDDANLDAYYVKAAAQARFNLAAMARATLLQAAAQDPTNFITWTLLGDLEVRAGHVLAARSYYGRALGLDPREPGLRALAAAPARPTHRPAR